MEKQSGKRPEQLDGPELPDELRYLWDWFIRISNRRPNFGFGPVALTSDQLLSWCVLNGLTLLPFEIDAIELLDDLYMTQQAKRKAP